MSNSKAATRRPDNAPFDLNLDAVQAEAELAPFVFQWGGRRWTFEHLQALDVWPLLEVAARDDAGAMLGTFRAALGEDGWKAFQKVPMPAYKMQALFTAYQKHCGYEPGESPASDGS